MHSFRASVRSHPYVYSIAGLILLLIAMPVFGSAAAAQVTATPTPRVQQTLSPGPDVTVIISEPYLNQIVDEALEERPDLQNPVVDLKENSTAEVAASMPLLSGISVRPRAQMTLAVIDGEIQAKIVSFELNGFGVPRAIVNSRLSTLEDELNLTINRELVSQLQPAGLRLTGVRTNETQMIIEMRAIQPASQR